MYAHWTANKYKVSFNGNGGTPAQPSKEVTYGQTYGTLPTATRRGYKLNGWYTSASGGNKIETSTTFNNVGDVTLYAHWKASESGGGGTGGGTGGGSTSCTGSFVVTSDTHVSCPSCGSYSSDSDVHQITETCNGCGASTTYYGGLCTCSGFKTTSPSRIHKY